MSNKPKRCEFVGGPKNGQMMHVQRGLTRVTFEELSSAKYGFSPVGDGAKPVVTKTHVYKEVEPGRFCYFGMI